MAIFVIDKDGSQQFERGEEDMVGVKYVDGYGTVSEGTFQRN